MEFFAEEQKLLKSGGHYDREERATDLKTGETRWLRTTKVPLRDSEGKLGRQGRHIELNAAFRQVLQRGRDLTVSHVGHVEAGGLA